MCFSQWHVSPQMAPDLAALCSYSRPNEPSNILAMTAQLVLIARLFDVPGRS